MSIIDSGLFKATVGDIIQTGAQQLYNTIAKHVPQTHEKQMALTNIEQAASWALKALEIAIPAVAPIAAIADDVVQGVEQAAPTEQKTS